MRLVLTVLVLLLAGSGLAYGQGGMGRRGGMGRGWDNQGSPSHSQEQGRPMPPGQGGPPVPMPFRTPEELMAFWFSPDRVQDIPTSSSLFRFSEIALSMGEDFWTRNKLLRRRARFLERLAQRGDNSFWEDSLFTDSRSSSRRMIQQLHAVQEEMDQLEKELLDKGRRILELREPMEAQLERLKKKWQKEELPPDKQRLAFLENLLDRLKALAEDDEKGAENLVKTVYHILQARRLAQMEPIQMRFLERLEKLERENAVLYQRLDANNRELSTLRNQMEALLQFQEWQQQKGPSPEEEGPPENQP